jgi:Tfp pilus assembly protein PilF
MRMQREKGSKKGVGKKLLKWIGIITAVISLVLGVRQVVSVVQDRAARKNKAAELRLEARRLSSSGYYSQAWQSISQAVELESDYRDAQVDIAMEWLRNVRLVSVRGEQTFTEIVEKLLPVLYRAIDTTRESYSASVLAHIGWANYLIFKEGDRGVKVDEQFRDALVLDSTNFYAHAMYGFWLLFPGHSGGSIDEANQHFAAALKNGKDTNYVRHLMFSAYRNGSEPEYQAQIIKLADEMRKNHETIERSERERILTGAYYMYRNEIMQEVGKVLSPKDHLETFLYLSQGIDVDAKPFLKEFLAKLRKAVDS